MSANKWFWAITADNGRRMLLRDRAAAFAFVQRIRQARTLPKDGEASVCMFTYVQHPGERYYDDGHWRMMPDPIMDRVMVTEGLSARWDFVVYPDTEWFQRLEGMFPEPMATEPRTKRPARPILDLLASWARNFLEYYEKTLTSETVQVNT